jgi:hypothetical protein
VTLEVHGVLAGAYKGRDIEERTLLTHVSLTESWDTALCRNVKPGMLADLTEPGPPTCKRCAVIWEKRQTVTATPGKPKP